MDSRVTRSSPSPLTRVYAPRSTTATSWSGLSSTMAATMASTSSDMRSTGPTGLLIGVLPLLGPADLHDVQRGNPGLGHGDIAGNDPAVVADHEPGVPRGHPPAHHLCGDLP